jgi:ribosomal protein S18 acetylase RimI-like enzyme
MTSSAWSKPTVVIRLANLDDASLLASLGARTFSETFAADNSDADMDAYLSAAFSEEQQTAELVDPTSTFYIAENDGVAVGYAMLRSGSVLDSITNDRPIELVRLYVSQEQIGQGVGAALMQACIDEAGRQGSRTLWLGVWENNHRAQAFYRRWEFHEVGTHIFQLGNDPQTDILMERSISAS